MRILVTPNGKFVIEDLATMPNPRKKSHRRTISFDGFRPKFKIKKSPPKYKLENKLFSIDDTNVSADPIMKSAKYVNLKSGRIMFPKGFQYKYETAYEGYKDGNIISSSLNHLPSLSIKYNKTESGDSSKNLISTVFSFKDIIPNKTLTDLKIDFLKDKREKDKMSRITEDQFRTYYQPLSEISKINEVIKSPIINATKTSLIQYLNQKKKVSPITLQNIYESDAERINKFNKMSQIVLHNREEQIKFEGTIKKKLERKINEVKIK
ncbi:MAG: hypothetical protein MJ252_30085, partial [archaeon]|nr:hypothetical protein [archaeon]